MSSDKITEDCLQEKKITKEDLNLDCDEDEESYYETDESDIELDKSDEHYLSNDWTIWYHRLNDNDWTIDGYKKIYSFSTIEDFWRVFNTLIHPGETEVTKMPFILRGDFFIMKNDILPMWEDPANLKGCSESYLTQERPDDKEIESSDFDEWRELAMFLISNHGENINGISSSPKQKNFLMKIWKGDCENTIINGSKGGFTIDLIDTKRKVHKESSENNKNDRRHGSNRGRGDGRGGGNGRDRNGGDGRDRNGGDRRDRNGGDGGDRRDRNGGDRRDRNGGNGGRDRNGSEGGGRRWN